jgi:hypothetical protein
VNSRLGELLLAYPEEPGVDVHELRHCYLLSPAVGRYRTVVTRSPRGLRRASVDRPIDPPMAYLKRHAPVGRSGVLAHSSWHTRLGQARGTLRR